MSDGSAGTGGISADLSHEGISVLLPVRNGARTIEPAVRSILLQTCRDFELLLLDDGSSDDTIARVQALGDRRIRIVSDGRRLGLVGQLNKGVALARGRYFARMDADDLAMPDRFERKWAFLQQNQDVDLVGSRAVVFREDMQVIGLLPYRADHASITAQPWRGLFLAHPTWMGRAEWFRKYGYRTPEVLRAEDQELLLRALPQSRYAVLPDVLMAYRQGPISFASRLVARRSLVAAQVPIFVARGEWWNALLAAISAPLKIATDVLVTMRGRDFHFAEEPQVPADVCERFRSACGACGLTPADGMTQENVPEGA